MSAKKEKQAWISEKVSKLRKEGYSVDQAVAIAHGMRDKRDEKKD